MSILQINYDRNSFPEQSEAVTLPGSKSIAARLLVLDYINSKGEAMAERDGMPDCDDTIFLSNALRRLKDGGADGRYDLGSGAASLRFFVALAASLPGFEGVVDCSAQLRRRPLSPLINALRGIGADIECMEREGYPPLYIKGKTLRGGKVRVDGSVSSQFVSAMLLVEKLWIRPLTLRIDGEEVSRPYSEMTRKVVENYGKCEVEPDWSAAAFFYEVALLCPGREILLGRLTDPAVSVQGDAASRDIFNLLGVETTLHDDGSATLKGNASVIRRMSYSGIPLEFDLNGMPDLVPALAVGMALAGIKYRFVNIGHLRHKESDRISALQMEMEKIGFGLESGSDWLSWIGRRLPVGENETIDSHDDHRIVMAFAPAAAKLNYVGIRSAECVAKSFPGFVAELEKLGFTAKFIDNKNR